MAWVAYRIRFRLLAPLHVGAGRVGNVLRARPYVTGKVLWGALTARLTRDWPKWGGDYAGVGQRVNSDLAFSYFYPLAEDEEALVVWPWGETGDEFAWRYLGSYASTAQDSHRKAAEDGSLHEVEYIAPHTRDGRHVDLLGYILARESCDLPWKAALLRLSLGSDRSYGWGRVSLAAPPREANGQPLFGRYVAELEGERPLLRAHREGGEAVPLLAHSVAHDHREGDTVYRAVIGAQGLVELLVGRETVGTGGFGTHISRAWVCWAPGATVGPQTGLVLGPWGLWASAG